MKLMSFLICCCLLASAAARAEDDHDRARRAVLAGRAVPLEEILDRVRDTYGDSPVLATEIEEEGESIVYEIKLLTDDGRVVKLKYDGSDGHLLSSHDQGHGGHRR